MEQGEGGEESELEEWDMMLWRNGESGDRDREIGIGREEEMEVEGR